MAACSACRASASQSASRAAAPKRPIFSSTCFVARKLAQMKVARFSPMRSLLLGITAVCGIFRPSGWRNSATTANQSAIAPTIAASANAATYGHAGWRSPSAEATRYSSPAPTSRPRAMACMRSGRVFTRGAGFRAPCNEDASTTWRPARSAIDAPGLRESRPGATGQNRTRSPPANVRPDATPSARSSTSAPYRSVVLDR